MKNKKLSTAIRSLLPSKPKEQLSINRDDDYVDLDANLDFGNGCVIIADIVVDVAGDVAVDVIADVTTDVVADAAADTASDVAADAASDAASDAAADVASEAAADVVADVAAEPGVSSGTKTVLKGLALIVGTTVVTSIVEDVYGALKSAISNNSSDPSATTAAQYWSSLYSSMVAEYPCNNNATTSCGTNVRNDQLIMVGTYQIILGQKSPASAQAAANLMASSGWSQTEDDLKNALMTVTETGGIPSMLEYMESYTNPDASGATLVIATANVVISVADFAFNDIN